VVEEKGWWEGEDSPEAEPSPEAPDSSKEVEVGEGRPVVWMFAVLFFICMTYLETWIEDDSTFLEVCFSGLLWILFS
jgi:hypothetical protein